MFLTLTLDFSTCWLVKSVMKLIGRRAWIGTDLNFSLWPGRIVGAE